MAVSFGEFTRVVLATEWTHTHAFDAESWEVRTGGAAHFTSTFEENASNVYQARNGKQSGL